LHLQLKVLLNYLACTPGEQISINQKIDLTPTILNVSRYGFFEKGLWWFWKNIVNLHSDT